MLERYGEFCVDYQEDGAIRSLVNRTDPCAMNWAEGARSWGTVSAPAGIAVQRSHSWQDGELEER